MEQRGIATERGNINHYARINNREIRELKKQLYQINKWIKEQEENAEQRLKELDIILKEADIYKANKAVYNEYISIIKPRKRNRFYENNRADICLYEAAERMLSKHIKSSMLPINEWKAECEKLTVEKDKYYKQYFNLKNEVDKFTKVKIEVDGIVRRDTLNRVSQIENHGQQQKRNRGFSR